MLKVQHKLGKYGNQISEFAWISEAHSFIYIQSYDQLL